MNKDKNINFTHIINYLALAYAFVLPLSRAAIVFFTGSLIIMWLLEGNLIAKYKKCLKNKVILAIALFIILNFLTLLWTDDISLTLNYIRRYWYLLPILVFCTSIQKNYISKILSAFIMGMFVSEVISYGIYFEIWSFSNVTWHNPSPFMHHIEYSIFLAFTALVLLSRIFNEKNIKYKLTYFIFFTTMSGNLFLTAGRTGQLAFVVGLFVLALISFKNKFKAFIVSIFLTMFIFGIAYSLSTTFQKRVIEGQKNLIEVIDDKNYCTSWGGRVGAWIVSKDLIQESPLLGSGLIETMTKFHQQIDEKYPSMKCMHENFMHLHNQYLQIFAQLGFLGLLIFLYIFYSLFKLPLQNLEFKNIKYMYISVLLFAFMSEVVLHRQFSMVLFALVVGLLLAQNRIENEI